MQQHSGNDKHSDNNKSGKATALLNITKSFLKIGLIGFGGGSAFIPVMEKEVCENNNYIDTDVYTDYSVISNITPGALPSKLGALIGYDMAGKTGMFLAALFTALPGVVLTLGLLALIDVLGTSAVSLIEQAAIGISVFIIFLLISYIVKVQRDSKKSGFAVQAVALMLLTFFLTFGNELRQAFLRLGFENAFAQSAPIFDISTINILILLFFFIFFTGGKIKSVRSYIALALSMVYILLFGKSAPLDFGIGNVIFQVLLLLSAVILLIYDTKKDIGDQTTSKIDWFGATKKSLPFIISTAAVLVLCLVIGNEHVMSYFTNGVVSTATSFGGGAAYLTVAEGIFVNSGTVSATEFYSRVLPIANALPGSILIKILAGIGFMLGFESSLTMALLMGVLGMLIATMASCVICIYIAEIYTSFNGLRIFNTIKLWVLPVICGLLLSTIMSMLNEVFTISTANALSPALMFVLLIAIYAMVYALNRWLKLNDVFLILLSAGVSVLGIMVF